MTISRLIALSATLSVSVTNALSSRLIPWVEKIKQLEDTYDPEFNQELLEFCKDFTFEDVWVNDDNTLGDEDRPIEQQVIKMDLALYQKTFFGPEKSTVPWFVSIVSEPLYTRKGRDDGIVLLNMMRVMAAEFEGRVRFAYIDHWNEEEQLHWEVMLEYWIVPNQYLFEPDSDGIYHASEMYNFIYDRVSLYHVIINELDYRSAGIYTTYQAMQVPNYIVLKLLHQFRFQFDIYRDHMEQLIVQNIWRVYEIDGPDHTFYEHYGLDRYYYDYYSMRTKVMHFMIAEVIAILSLLAMLWCCIRKCCCKKSCCCLPCPCRCCCSKKPQAAVEPQDKKNQ